MPLGRIPEPFDHSDWLFEIKYDGFRALAYVDDACSLVSRKAHTFKFPELAASIAAAVSCPVVLDGGGRPMRRRAEPYFYAFDILWRDGEDLCRLPLLERKRILRTIVPASGSRLLYVEHHRTPASSCSRRPVQSISTGSLRSRKDGLYTPATSTWVRSRTAATARP